ncbi:three-Cys-motif partner protein TcmP [Sandaracinobacteroides saxicola]|uniref:Three-Cys-motif partner protein TcmP n=1 Tax=Sandaracinobacteroides saxicola TaxID=2759707 RepID=A0A7G5IDP4_9SPHN|nr:three-Cys-motif partner protein TcmP [Sandaracinobacteroides saxicola]QMW21486.1 three-Cys-motif partner protein TcmP [Sandaracinobacteroides saxicola]
MGTPAEVGPWAREKLDALARYLDYYTKVLKNQPWRTIYFDAYAGGGQAIVRSELTSGASLLFPEEETDAEARQLIDGSPRVALGLANPFDRYIFVDNDVNRHQELEVLRREWGDRRTITARRGTATDAIDWLLAQGIGRQSHRGVAFLDPFGANLAWSDVAALASTRLFEVVINFPLGMAIQRMLPNTGTMPPSWAARLDGLFGNREWYDAVYQPEGGLFSSKEPAKRTDYHTRLLGLYLSQLADAFGHVSQPRLIRNSRGAPLYYLIWAGPHKKGLEGANYVLTMGERLPKRKDG